MGGGDRCHQTDSRAQEMTTGEEAAWFTQQADQAQTPDPGHLVASPGTHPRPPSPSKLKTETGRAGPSNRPQARHDERSLLTTHQEGPGLPHLLPKTKLHHFNINYPLTLTNINYTALWKTGSLGNK